MVESYGIEWIKLPQDIQHKLFQIAEQESGKIREVLTKLEAELNRVKEIIKPSRIKKLEPSDKIVKVAAIDSSRSPVLSERLGVRYGVFSVGVTFLQGNEREEMYEAGLFKRKQALSQDESKFMFDILTTFAERKIAKDALNKANFVIIDGAFYGFLYTALKMKLQGFYDTYHSEVVAKTFEMTNELVNSGKVIGVIKRSHTRAIGGYLALKDQSNPLTSVIDKLILSLIMDEGSIFEYESLIGNEAVPVYSHVATLVNKGKVTQSLIEEAREKIYRPFKELSLDKSNFEKLRRVQVRAYQGPPTCEIEYPTSINKGEFYGLIGQPNFFNEATNLPIALDLVDSSINISSRFADEFAEEVEGRVLELMGGIGSNREIAKTFFTLLNPQKRF